MTSFFVKVLHFAVLLIFFLGIAHPAFAQNELLFGQNHSYTVIFRGNGEAITYAKLVITNPEENPMTEFSFEMPKVAPSEMAIYQMTLPQTCIKYNYSYNDPSHPCLEYGTPDYNQNYYYNNDGTTEYKKIQYKKSGSLYRFTLPTPIESYKSTALIVAYAAKGYVSESFGLYSFNFETIKVPARIQKLTVSVDVDSDLLLKGKRAKVQYETSALGKSDSYMSTSSISSRDLDRVVGGIGSYGPLVKEAKNLAPNESFIVKGEYASSWFRMYLGSILLVIFIIGAIFAGIYFLGRFLKRKNREKNEIIQSIPTETVTGTTPHSAAVFTMSNVAISLSSFASVVGLSYLLKFLGDSSLSRMMYDPVISIVTAIAIVLLYILIITIPAILVGIKRGWKSLVFILIAQLLWFFLFLALYLILFQTGVISKGSSGNPGMYY